jgi:hypothetical protein
MTEIYPPAHAPGDYVPPPPGPAQQATADVVKAQAADLGQSGVDAGKHAASVAQEQASQVAAEATRQGRDLLRQAQQQAGDQAARGQQRLAAELLSLGHELSDMANGSAQQGMAADLARQAASRAQGAGRWLDDRGPAQVLDGVQAFARRRPGVFLALAAGAGLVAGRLTRGLSAAHDDDAEPATPASAPGRQQAAAPSWTHPDAVAADPLAGAGSASYQPGTAGETAYPAEPRYSAEPGYRADSGLVAADDGSAVPVVDGLPASEGGSAWDVDPQADELGTLGRHEAGNGGAL